MSCLPRGNRLRGRPLASQRDRELMLEAVKQNGPNESMLEAVMRNGPVLQLPLPQAAPKPTADHKYKPEAVKQNGDAPKATDPHLKADPRSML